MPRNEGPPLSDHDLIDVDIGDPRLDCQYVVVADDRTLVAASSAKTAGFGVPSFVPKWRTRQDKTTNTYVLEISI
jgi:hypothetical protein